MAKITFTLRYNSYFGEDLFIKGDIAELGSKSDDALAMEYTDKGWVYTIETNKTKFKYSYSLHNQQGQTRKENESTHEFNLPTGNYSKIYVYDVFEEGNQIPKPLLSTAFTKGIMMHEEKRVETKGKSVPVIFNIKWANLPAGQELSIIGNNKQLGNWNEDDATKLRCTNYPEFCAVLDANKMFFPLEYKYVVTNSGSTKIQMWEEGSNHHLSTPNSDADIIIVNDGLPHLPVQNFKGAGVAVPVFSLRSANSFGVGEFEDLKLLSDWATKTGQKIIQMLPINDTTNFRTWKDSYPYSGISVFALHPLYLNIEKMGEVPDMDRYKRLREELNAEKFVDYEAVLRYKWEFISKIYSRDKNKVFSSNEYKDFYARNKYWLNAYAVFSHLRDKFGTAEFSRWKDDAIYDEKRIDKYCDSSNKEFDCIGIHMFVQFFLDKQLKDAVSYAHKAGVAMKGDIPIGVNRNSVEVWMNTRLFDCNGQAGAPPDDFSKFGQNWGFPIYNWDEMKKDGYSWWCNRLKKMQEYFDAYRIDHILGFFRIFRIPIDSTMGLLGQFCPALSMTKDEIEEYGIKFSQSMCEPFIHEDYLEIIFGDDTEYVKTKFLKATGKGQFKLKDEFGTQVKIDQNLSEEDKKNENLRNGLKILTCQVLFVTDMNNKKKYHPRIALYQSFVYKMLPQKDKEAFSKLYNDFFYVRNNDFWYDSAMAKLPELIKSTNMMVCGEDLGMVPDCVHPAMDNMSILSLEIQRMPKEFGVEFGELPKVPYMSVCTSSTHDMSTTRQWWEEDRERTQRYYNNVLHEYGPAPLFCEPWICQRIIEMHLKTNSMWVILPLQDWMSMDGALRNNDTFCERINVPADPDNYWRYRMHINLEDLNQATELNQKINALVKYYGR